MSTVGYDLDTSGGLMPLIRALIKPPDEEANGQKSKKQQHPYYKRPGKGHNRDSCDACGEGGDLICCDRCPASFHLGCYDPPLDEHCIPAGLWLCRQCSADDAAAEASTSQPIDTKQEDKKRTLRTKKSKDDIKEESDTDSKKSGEGKEALKKPSPMELLVSAARVMNPTQFELPRELRVPCPFPGTEKEGSNGSPSVVTLDSQGLVPLPAKTCHSCGGTCKMAPLIQCDYCPLLFHQDCLDPPLTALPTGRWMCPNHVEQYLDWKLVNSISATERVALWDHFAGPVDQQAIKVDFIRRARNKHPRFRIKAPCSGRGRMVVPDVLKDVYVDPPSLLPSRREAVRCRDVLKNKQSENLYTEEADCDVIDIVCRNMECPGHKGQGRCPAGRQQTEEGDGNGDGEKAEKQSDTSDDDDVDYTSAPRKRRRTEHPAPTRPGIALKGDAAQLLDVMDRQLDKLDQRIVKILAWQRLQQILVGEQCRGPWRRAPLSAAAERLIALSLDRNELAKHGFRHVALPSELLTTTERLQISKSVFGGWEHLTPPQMESPGHSLSDTALRATFSPVTRASGALGDSIGRPVPMRLSRFTVGSHSGCDLVLDGGSCMRVSQRHALIFCDEVSQHFELINYSEWGSMVNGVMYGCDLTHTETEQHEQTIPLIKTLGNNTAKRPSGPDPSYCRCPVTRAQAAWEGSAIVTHGALLQFGCHMFVFSVVDAPVDTQPAL